MVKVRLNNDELELLKIALEYNIEDAKNTIEDWEANGMPDDFENYDEWYDDEVLDTVHDQIGGDMNRLEQVNNALESHTNLVLKSKDSFKWLRTSLWNYANDNQYDETKKSTVKKANRLFDEIDAKIVRSK